MPKLEICCASAEDVIAAERGGADRAELNAALCLGGLTPSIGTLIAAKEQTSIPVMCMVRPREGGFCLSETEFRTAVKDAELLIKYGADGLVFGFLRADGTLDTERCKTILALCGNRDKVFHRAIDVCTDWKCTLGTLIELGFRRVLTSGRARTALEGAEMIREMRTFAAGAIEILPGAGIRLHNVREVLSRTGCTQAHMSCGTLRTDMTVHNTAGIAFNGSLPAEENYKVADTEMIARIRAEIDRS